MVEIIPEKIREHYKFCGKCPLYKACVDSGTICGAAREWVIHDEAEKEMERLKDKFKI